MALAPESGQMRREQLERILASQTFQGAERSRTLLRFVVEQALDDRADRLKEYTLGAEALGKGETFDPRTDPIVRAEASRLRNRLDRYYATDGQTDPLVIGLQGQLRPAVSGAFGWQSCVGAPVTQPVGERPAPGIGLVCAGLRAHRVCRGLCHVVLTRRHVTRRPTFGPRRSRTAIPRLAGI